MDDMLQNLHLLTAVAVQGTGRSTGCYVKSAKRRKKLLFNFFAKKIYSHEKQSFLSENFHQKAKFLQVAMLRNKTNIFLLKNTVFGFLTYPLSKYIK